MMFILIKNTYNSDYNNYEQENVGYSQDEQFLLNLAKEKKVNAQAENEKFNNETYPAWLAANPMPETPVYELIPEPKWASTPGHKHIITDAMREERNTIRAKNKEIENNALAPKSAWLAVHLNFMEQNAPKEDVQNFWTVEPLKEIT